MGAMNLYAMSSLKDIRIVVVLEWTFGLGWFFHFVKFTKHRYVRGLDLQ